jgi:hypothetical protein
MYLHEERENSNIHVSKGSRRIITTHESDMGDIGLIPVEHKIIEQEEYNHAHLRTEAEDCSACQVSQIHGAQSGAVRAKP